MMMEIFLSEKKAEANQISIKDCYKILDDYFDSKGIRKVKEGVYLGDDTQRSFDACAIAVTKLPESSWFIKIVDAWYWRVDSNDIEDREDCLDSWQRICGMKH